MFNLKKVYGVISFEETSIKILVLEKKEDVTNCIYFDQIKLGYYDRETTDFINPKELNNALANILSAVDIFVGVPIKRYIVNISFLSTRVVSSVSQTFLVFEKTLTVTDYKKFISQINFLDQKSNEAILKVKPIVWKLDGKSYSDFPLGEIGTNINFEYTAYTVNRKVIHQFYDLMDSLKITVLSYLNNDISIGGLLTKRCHDDNVVIISISEYKTNLNFFHKCGLKKTRSLNYGIDGIKNDIKIRFGLSSNTNINPFLKTINFLKEQNPDTAVLNMHVNSFLSLKEANASDVLDLLKLIIKKVQKLAAAEIDSYNTTYACSCDKIFVHIDDFILQELFRHIVFYDKENLPLDFFDVTITSLEEENVANLIGAIEETMYEQQLKHDTQFSIDPFVSQESLNSQTKKQVIIRLGVISTKWAAKLEE